MDLYDELGVTRVINASGSMTVFGGSLIAPEVLEVMARAARSFVRMEELLAWAGRELAGITGAEAAMVTTGAAGGMLLAAAACLTGKDRARQRRLPDTAGWPRQVVVQKLHRLHFDHAVRTTGAELVEAGDAEGTEPWELEAAISADTVAVLHVVLDPQPTVPLAEVVRLAHDRGVPVILDAAAEVPPKENLRAFVEQGVDLVIFSGGKAIGGPNDTGILCGRRDLIEAAAMQAFPRPGIGRPLKVSKEQIVGLVFALRRFVALDHQAEMRRWEGMVQALHDRLQGLAGVRTEKAFATSGARPRCIPRVRVEIDPQVAGRTAAQVLVTLGEGRPAVAVYGELERSTLWLNPQHLADPEVEIVASRLRQALGG